MEFELPQTIDGQVSERVGFVGLGHMGSRIAQRLCICGIPIVAFNRTFNRSMPVEALGATFVGSPAEVGLSANLIFTAVTGPNDVREVLLGQSGVCESQRNDLIVVDVSTIDPMSSREIANELKKRGIEMLDAPLSGSVQDAEMGTLGLLVGGQINVLNQIRHILENIGTVYHFGPNGSGCIAKLSLNLLLAAMVQSLGEAFALLEASGLSHELFLSAISTSGLSSPLFERVGSRVLNGDIETRFSLGNLQKDLSLLNNVTKQVNIDLKMASLLNQIVSKAALKYSDKDYSALIIAEVKRICTLGPDITSTKEYKDASID